MNLTEFRRSYIKLDKASQSYITPQYVKQGDYNGRELIVQITDGGAVKDMTGVSLELGWKHESIQNAGLEPFAELDVSQGLFKVAYPTELLNPGRVLCAIRVSENGTVTNSMNFTVTVEANPFDDTTLVSDNAFTLLEQLIQDSDATKIYEVDDRLTNQINETDTRLTSQLAEKAQFSDLLTPNAKVRIMAHRGESTMAPENTLPAYELAADAGYWGAECDVQVTSDGIWVLMHDSTVDRTTDGTGNVKDKTLAQIKALTVDTGNNISLYPNLKIPTLEEFLILCKRKGIMPCIEIKGGFGDYSDTNYMSLVDLLERNGFARKCLVMAFSPPILNRLREINVDLPLVSLNAFTEANIDYVTRLGNAMLGVDKNNVTKANVELAHEKNVLISAYTVNNSTDLKTLIDAGVDFVTTDGLVWGDKQ